VTCQAPDPTGYGRILRDETGRLNAIVEEKDAGPAERAINEINAGIYAFDAAWLRTQLPRVERSPAGEYYLPDLVALAITEAQPDTAWPVTTVLASLDEALGINDRVQLATAEAVLRRRILHRLMLGGVTIIDPVTTYIDDAVTIGPDTTIYPGTTITGPTTIGGDCRIGPHAMIDSSVIADGCRVVASMIEQSRVEAGVDIGPFSHLRPGASLGPGVHIGNFAEIKNARIGAETAIGHVSYIGDASVGERVNIGAGTITCNYDGVHKHRTVIGDDVFIGSDTMLVAPVEVGARGRTGAGAVVTRDVPPDTLVVGVPARPRPGREE
jgi:bifunctional UDP-N-acetylglucosamine pyrophosphorylase/glucosamine-1-phosphate N-acetyltransferase